MYQHLFDYFNDHPHKQLFFINDLIIDLKLSEPILRKQLLSLTTKFPSIGTYNRNTGWLMLSDIYHPLKKNRKAFLSKEYYIPMVLFVFSILTQWFIVSFIVLLFALGLVMNEVYDNLCYLKDFKL